MFNRHKKGHLSEQVLYNVLAFPSPIHISRHEANWETVTFTIIYKKRCNEGGQLGGPLFNINTRTGYIAVLLMVVIVMCYGYPPTQGMKVVS